MSILTVFLSLLGIEALFLLVLWKLEEIFAILRKLKLVLIELYSRITEKKLKIMDWENISFQDDAEWYCNEKLIAHACGGNVRLNYTNSKEAFKQALSDGFRVVEVDTRFTKDQILVCTHDFEGAPETPEYAAFMAGKIDGRFSPMDFEQCRALAEENKIALIIDVKMRDELPSVAQYIRKKGGLSNIYIQIASEAELEQAAGLPILYNLTFTEDYERVTAFCVKNNIRVVSISAQRLQKDEDWKILLNHNIKIYGHTVNSLFQYEDLRRKGIAGVFTDFMILKDISI